MKSNFTLSIMMALVILFAACSKDDFNESDAIAAQKELLNLKYQHELDLELLKQKGATALQQLINDAALEQLKMNDSLAIQNAITLKKQDYSITVVDVYNNTPIADADVTVSSEGKVYAAKTNAQGLVTFNALYLFPTSSFVITKTGYAATKVLQQNISSGAVPLWNNSELSNEISGKLYIETDLTNSKPETVGENVLVTASTVVPTASNGFYSVLYPTYTTATGSYAIQVPASPNGYTLKFQQIKADQRLFVNATEDDAVTTFPASLPRATTITTYFNVNSFTASIPTVNNYYYFKVSADLAGNSPILPGYSSYYGYNQVYMTALSNKFQIQYLYTNNYYYNSNGIYTLVDFSAYTYAPSSKIDVQLVDVTGTLIETAPILMAQTDATGKLISTNSPEGGSGYIHLKRDATGALVANARGVILKGATNYNSLYTLNYTSNLNTTTNTYVSNGYLLTGKGDKKVVNFYYGSGDSRVKQVY